MSGRPARFHPPPSLRGGGTMQGWCECGRGLKEHGRKSSPDSREMAGCRFCNALDGRTGDERDVINTLRVTGPATIPCIAFELNKTEAAAVRQLIRMRKKGVIAGRHSFYDEPRSSEVEYYARNKGAR